jgi:hypothetical protein
MLQLRRVCFQVESVLVDFGTRAMKQFAVRASLVALLFSLPALAQNEGDDIPLGSSASKVFCAGADGKLRFPSCSASGASAVSGTVNVVATPGAASFLQNEDAAIASGQTGMVPLAVQNETQQTFSATVADAVPMGADRYGTQQFSPQQYGASAGSFLLGAVRTEDGPIADGQATMLSSFITQDPLSVDQGAAGDVAIPKVDRVGRQIFTMAPAGESFQACGTATATTADVAIKAAVASNRMYVTAITCKNTSATVATSLDFKDATTVMAVGGISQMAAGAAGSFTATFPVPLRGTVNTALNFATNVSVSSVTCCASGYVSVN